jgi:hypothetical protein
MVPEEIFYNKKLSDTIRDIVLNSACNFNEALELLNESKDYERDSFIIKKMRNVGYRKRMIKQILITLNN